MRSREDRVKSVYLSTGRFSDRESADVYREDLRRYGEAIARGESIEFDKFELMRIGSMADVVEGASWPAIARYLFGFFFPVAVVLACLWTVIWLID